MAEERGRDRGDDRLYLIYAAGFLHGNLLRIRDLNDRRDRDAINAAINEGLDVSRRCMKLDGGGE